jgi:hypothetical protein
VITEPEMADESGGDRFADVLGQDDGPEPPAGGGGFPGGAGRRYPWFWALGGIVLASAVWAGALRAIGYGHTNAPDLHGYHLTESPCTGQNLQPLVDKLSATSLNSDNGPVSTGSTLDHVSCYMTGDTAAGDGWVTSYTVSVSVDLHKKTDPKVEFVDATQVAVSAPDATLFDGKVYVPRSDRRTKLLTGLGDRAYLTTGDFSQSVNVLHGGAVFSISVSANNVWNGQGSPPTNADGSSERPLLVDTRPLAAELPRTVRHLMSVLTKP